MCGIVGGLRVKGQKFNWKRNRVCFNNMLNAIKHRGIDDRGVEGISFDENLMVDCQKSDDICFELDGLVGFNRLSIQDVSENGHQPMKNEGNTVMVAFNGEIYNAVEYRGILQKKGWIFHGTSDTEVILNMYLEYGLDKLLNVLNGMFSICIVDARIRKSYLVRDRFGIKPMYYIMHNENIFFSSEYKCFLYLDEFIPELNTKALMEGMMFISSKEVLLKQVKQVQPGEVLAISDGRVSSRKYFDINNYERLSNSISKEQQLMELESIIKDAVQKQMVSDVKVGCQLSGGVDSSLISFYAAQYDQNAMKDTVSIIFDDAQLNEEIFIDRAAEIVKVKTHKYLFEQDFFINNAKKHVWYLEGIPTVTNSLALFLLTQKAKEEVTVLLSGEGADEVFCGYGQYSKILLLEECKKKGVDLFREYPSLCKRWKIDPMDDVEHFAVMSTMCIEPDLIERVLGINYASEIIEDRIKIIKGFQGIMPDRFIKYEMQTYLPELLVRQDKMSMANTIENRVPMLDNTVVDYAFKLSPALLIEINNKAGRSDDISNVVVGKMALKELCSKYFGREFAYRGKGGFGVPLKKYLGGKRFREYFYDSILCNMKQNIYIDSANVERLYQRLFVLDWQELELLWRSITLEWYIELFLGKKGLYQYV